MGGSCVIVVCLMISAVSAAQYNLTGSPQTLIAGESIEITLKCETQANILQWRRNGNQLAVILNPTNENCSFFGNHNTNYSYTCDKAKGSYLLSIIVIVTKEFNDVEWECGYITGDNIESLHFIVYVPVTTLTIKPAGNKHILDFEIGETKTLTCTTDYCRPAAWIQWYIGDDNVTDQAQPQISQDTSSSKLNYTGLVADHNKLIYCEAINIEGRDKIKSKEKSIYIQIPVNKVTITPYGEKDVIYIQKGETATLLCTTDFSRPASRIYWYMGDDNVTELAEPQPPILNGSNFISSSKLIYIGKDGDHNKTIYCEAINIDSRDAVQSNRKKIYIQIQVTTVEILPAGNNNVVDVLKGATMTFTCYTGISRPAAWIEWYIGGQNVTEKAKPQTPQSDGSNFTSSSILNHTWGETDHNKTIHCEAKNIKNRTKAISQQIYIFIQIPVTRVIITPAGEHNLIEVVEGKIQQFNCSTDASRPTALIQWFIGGKRVSNQQSSEQQLTDGIISFSRLSYIGNDSNHNTSIFCEAYNTVNSIVNSANITLYIKIPVKTVQISPTGTNNVTDVVEGHTLLFTCTTGFSRPASTIQWYIGGQDVTNQTLPQNTRENENKFQSRSIFKYIGHDRDHNKYVFCKAANIAEEETVNSINISIFIKFGPKNISLDTTSFEYTVTEANSIQTIKCVAHCRPDCTYNWTGPNGFETKGHSLQLGPVFRNQTGKYFCNARNNFGLLSFDGITIIVNYSPSIVNLTVNNETRENKEAIFQCNIDSHPASTITWTYGNVVLKTNNNVTKSIYTIANANCLQTGTYQCQANNTIDDTIQSKIGRIDLFVLCSARHDKRIPDIPNKIGINDDDLLNVTAYLIAYPMPAIQWSFKNESVKSKNTIGIFEHHTSILKRQIGNHDFGIYTLYAYNQIGEPYVKEYDVFPQRKPTPPTNITAKCDIISIEVFWKSESDGGNRQKFKVSWWNQDKNETIYSTDIEDLGEGKYHSETTHLLTPNTLYFVFVEATNNHGPVTSLEHVNCTTKRKQTEDSFAVGSLIGGVLGSLCAVVVITAAILIYFRHTKKSKDDTEPIRRKKKNEVTDEDEEGLHDNPLYLSSAQASGVDNGALYSIVNKKSESEKATPKNDDQGPVYSQIQKTDKKERQERKDKKAKKHDKNVQHGCGIELGSVYENSELRSNINHSDSELYANSAGKDSPSLSKSNYKPSKNKDGLIYADLDLVKGPTGKKFVIRGLENRNNYAIIDLTKTAEPLPSSDEDDEKENK